MRKIRYRLRTWTLLGFVLLVSYGLASAFTLSQSDGVWSNAIGAPPTYYPPSCLVYNNTASTTDENTVSYGVGVNATSCATTIFEEKSGFGFQGKQSLNFNPNEPFVLGQLTHYNNPILVVTSPTDPRSFLYRADLNVNLNFSSPSVSKSLVFTLELDETPNTVGACPYPGSTVCTDRVTFVNTVGNDTFVANGVQYTLEILGFVPGTLNTCNANSTPIDQFLTEERQRNDACLIGRIVEARKITIIKQIEGAPTTSPWYFYVDGTYASVPAAGGTTTVTKPSGAQYTVIEIAQTGYEVTSSCTDGSTGFSSVTLDLGSDDVTCTFLNRKPDSTITIRKEANAFGTFNFTGSLGSFALTTDGSRISNGLSAGIYTVTETIPAGWTLQGVTCDGQPMSVINGTININLTAGQNRVCTFTNQRQTGSITVSKEADSAGTFNFTGSLNSFSLTSGESKSFTNLPIGTYNLQEIVPPGWSLKGATCDNVPMTVVNNQISVNLGAGQNISCKFTNELQKATLTVEKVADGAGTFDFSGTLGSFSLSSGTSTTFTVNPGLYAIQETLPGGWRLQGVTCDNLNMNVVNNGITVNMVAGQNTKCTFTNQRSFRVVTLEKIWKDENGAVVPAPTAALRFSNFSLTANSDLGSATCQYLSGNFTCNYGEGLAGLPVAAGGSYTVNETGVPDGWQNTSGLGTFTVCSASTCNHQVVNSKPVPAVDIAVLKSVDLATAFLNDTLTYTVEVSNNGPANATNVTFTDNLPDGVEFVSAVWSNNGLVNQACSQNLGVISCSIGGVNALGTPAEILITVTATELGEQVNEAQAYPQGQTDSNLENNKDDAATLVQEVLPECENPDPKAHLSAQIIQGATANEWIGVITNSSDCPYDVGMASYEKIDNILDNQTLYDSDTALQIGPGETRLTVSAPSCAVQLDVFFDASHLGVYPEYDGKQAQLDLAPLVLDKFNTDNYGPYGRRYGTRLLAYRHINGNLWCDLPPDVCTIGTMTVTGITDGMTLSGILTVEATFDGVDAPTQVVFDLNGVTHTENSAPFVYLGDGNSWNTNNLPIGNYTMTVTAFQGSRQCGQQVFNLTVEDDNTSTDPEIDVAIQKEGPATAELNEEFTYTLTVTNLGPDAGTGVQVTDTLPAGISFLSSEQCVDNGGGSLSCEVGNLAPQQSVALFIQVKVNQAGEWTNTATVSVASPTEENLANNTSSVTTVVEGEVTLPYPLPPECAGIEIENVIVGTNGSEEILGTPMNDVIFALGGSDWVYAGDGNDCVVGGDGDDLLEGQGGYDILLGENGSDCLFGGAADDYLNGGPGSDAPLVGNAGNDTIFGGGGHDELFGDGIDHVSVGHTEGEDSGGAGNDLLFGEAGNDLLYGGGGSDILDGGEGSDDILGDEGDDTLTGGGSSDGFNGGAGTDTATDFNDNVDWECIDVEIGCPIDTDADTIDDSIDNCPDVANTDQADLDADLIGDVCDPDLDGDTFDNEADNCPDMANEDQADIDADLIGDACDPEDNRDQDADGVPDTSDNCLDIPNSDQADGDGDLIGDACDGDLDNDGIENGSDACPNYADDGIGDPCNPDDNNPPSDTDSDGILDESDNCVDIPNGDQADGDGDLIGDACDGDLDNDGIENGSDACPNYADDGIGDPCNPDDNNPPSDIDSDGIPDESDNCVDISNSDQADGDGDLIGDACDSDLDNDGIDNGSDACPTYPNDGIGDPCNPDDNSETRRPFWAVLTSFFK